MLKKWEAILFILLIISYAVGFSAEPGKPLSEEISFYLRAKAQWDQESRELEAKGKPSKGHHNPRLFQEFLKRWPQGEFADQVFLMLLEENTCADWKGYPDCGILEVKAYEEFLSRYPESKIREEVLVKMARAYYQMAYLWVYGKGEPSEKWSDLFRAQALALALSLKKSNNPETARAGEELYQNLSQNFKRPMAPIPTFVLDPNYL